MAHATSSSRDGLRSTGEGRTGKFLPSFYSEGSFEWGWSAEFPGSPSGIGDTQTPNDRLRTLADPVGALDLRGLGYSSRDTWWCWRAEPLPWEGPRRGLCLEAAHCMAVRDGRAVRM